LAVLDLSASVKLAVVRDIYCHGFQVTELRLPRSGFAALAAMLLPGSRVEVLYADIDAADIEQLLPQLDEWAIDRLRVVSPRSQGPFEWAGSPPSRSVAISNPAILNAPSAVTLTSWRRFPMPQLRFVRSFDLSALDELPKGEALSGSFFLESVILPARLRALPSHFFMRCPRLSHVGTADCVALEVIELDAFQDCRSLRGFAFPLMIRRVCRAFGGTSISCLNLSETRAESVELEDMQFLERLVLPRRCILKSARGLPALRSVTFAEGPGVWDGPFGWYPRQVRFERLVRPTNGGQLGVGTRACAEVACVLGRESFPFPP
jgi:hypothetical protein